MTIDSVRIGDVVFDKKGPLGVIAGPCVIESRELTLKIAAELKSICHDLELPFVFKASFDKANRTGANSYRGIGIESALEILRDVNQTLAVPVTTDIHESQQAAVVGAVCQLIQIPAFLARQTDLLVAAAATGKAVNVKKGQFMAPWDMKHAVEKLHMAGCNQILLTERGTFFGYGRLVNDMRAIPEMSAIGVPIVFDATHSVQEPSSASGVTGGQREMVPVLAAAAVAAGCHAVFVETHPTPNSSPSDAANMVPLSQMRGLLAKLVRIHQAVQ